MSTAAWQIAGLALVAGVLVGAAVYILISGQIIPLPERRERQRRRSVNERGRIGDGTITDVQPNLIYYSYNINGVDYTASQDVSALAHLLPPDYVRLVGPVTLKYSPRNPANSIVLCEEWSGLRARREETVPD